MAFRDRIKELRRVRAGDLKPCPWNWRQHPLAQREALQAVLAEVGVADACIAREVADGGLELIDGHLRAGLDPEQMVPVLVLDVDEEEAKKLLASLDPLVAMAEEDDAARRRLLEAIDAEEASLRKLIADMLAEIGEAEANGEKGERQPGGPVELDLRPHEHYDYVIVLAGNRHEWNQLIELLDISVVQSARMRKAKIGVGRGIAASRLISLLEEKGKTDGKPKNRRSK